MTVKIRRKCITCATTVQKGNYECKDCRKERERIESEDRRYEEWAREDLTALGIM